MSKNLNMSLLLDFYGDILSDKQREAADLFYNGDYSLSEISEITGITRQGVRDRIVKSEEIVTELEEKLGLAARFGDMGKTVAFIIDRLNQLKTKGQCVDDIIDAAKKLNKEL
ncbi:MAG: DNA-binding protein [Ruminococcaceae bacterium]|nr:DNA-binding protein [Oscillospiraceae bacterium]